MAEGALGNIRRFDGRQVASIVNQEEAEAIVQCLQVAFTKDGGGLAHRYLTWLKEQPAPRPKHAICCVLGAKDCVNTKETPWIVVPEDGKCPFPIDWTMYQNPDTQLLVYVQVPFYSTTNGGKQRSVKSHAFHTIA